MIKPALQRLYDQYAAKRRAASEALLVAREELGVQEEALVERREENAAAEAQVQAAEGRHKGVRESLESSIAGMNAEAEAARAGVAGLLEAAKGRVQESDERVTAAQKELEAAKSCVANGALPSPPPPPSISSSSLSYTLTSFDSSSSPFTALILPLLRLLLLSPHSISSSLSYTFTSNPPPPPPSHPPSCFSSRSSSPSCVFDDLKGYLQTPELCATTHLLLPSRQFVQTGAGGPQRRPHAGAPPPHRPQDARAQRPRAAPRQRPRSPRRCLSDGDPLLSSRTRNEQDIQPSNNPWHPKVVATELLMDLINMKALLFLLGTSIPYFTGRVFLPRPSFIFLPWLDGGDRLPTPCSPYKV